MKGLRPVRPLTDRIFDWTYYFQASATRVCQSRIGVKNGAIDGDASDAEAGKKNAILAKNRVNNHTTGQSGERMVAAQ